MPRAAALETGGGRIVGTPAYMAPEQLAGAAIDGRADQFSFCVSLWRALYDAAPYDASTADQRGAPAEELIPPAGARTARIPSRVHRALERGLTVDPRQRFGSMRELLAVLAPPRSRRTGLALGATAGAAVALGVTVWALASGSERDPCPAPATRAAAVWGPARRDAVRAHLAAIDPATGAARFTAAAAALDRAVPAWRDMHVAACRSTRVDEAQPDAMLDARMRCLDGWLTGVDAAVAGLETATDARALEAAIKPIGTPPALDRCADLKALAGALQLPAAPVAHDEAVAIMTEVAAINSDLEADRVAGLDARAAAVLARARTLAAPVPLSKALGISGRIAVATGDRVHAVEYFRELTQVAATARDDYEAVVAWTLMGRLTAWGGKPGEAKVMLAAARAALGGAGDPPGLTAEVLGTEADVFNAGNETGPALAKLTEALELLDAHGATTPGSPLAEQLFKTQMGLFTSYYYSGRLDDAVAAAHDAIATIERAYGPGTLERAAVDSDLAAVLRDQENYVEAEAAARECVELREALLGETPALASCLMSLADMLSHDDTRIAEAIGLGERALAIARAAMPETEMERRMLELGVANLYDLAGRTADALAIYAAILPGFERDGLQTVNLPVFYLLWADMERRVDRCADAIPHYHKAADLGRALGPDNLEVGSSLRGEAECLYRERRYADAIARLETAAPLPVAAYNGEDAGFGKALLGMLLADTGRDRARGVALVREAIAELATVDIDPADPRHARIEAWAAKHAAD